MSKSLVLLQLYQEECNSKRIIISLRSIPVDMQLAKLLARAEMEHIRRAKDMAAALDELYGSSEWNQNLPTAAAAPEPCQNPSEVYNLAEAQERKLTDVYRTASELVKSDSIVEAEKEQIALLESFLRMRTESTLKLNIRLSDLRPPE